MTSTDTPTTSPMVDLDANHSVEIIAICTVFSFLSLITILARLVSGRINSVGFKTDEALLIISWITAFGESVMVACATSYARGGWHIQALNQKQLVAFQKTFYAGRFLQSSSLATAKLSVLVLLRRIFVTPTFQTTVWILGVVVLAWWIGFLLADAFICFPASSIWNPNIHGTCGNQKILDYISPIPWVLTDFAILISPIPVIQKLQLPRNRKIELSAIFLMGGLTCVVSVLRYRTLFYSINDASWDIVPLSEWSIIELHITTICASVLASKPVVTMAFTSRPFPIFRSVWSRIRSQHASKSSKSSPQVPSRRAPSGSWAQNHRSSAVLPLYNYPNNDGESRSSSEAQNAISTYEIPNERRFGSSEEVF